MVIKLGETKKEKGQGLFLYSLAEVQQAQGVQYYH
jgi:hypothetical protein